MVATIGPSSASSELFVLIHGTCSSLSRYSHSQDGRLLGHSLGMSLSNSRIHPQQLLPIERRLVIFESIVFLTQSILDINPKEFRAWYGLGQTYEILEMFSYALYFFKNALKLQPKDTRMWRAIGDVYEKLNKRGYAIKVQTISPGRFSVQ